MKKISFILLSCVLFLSSSLIAHAYDRQDMYDTANRILQLSRNQGDYGSYSEMMEMYQDFRSKIKSDLELGNQNTAVDYELLTEGLVLENYQALQSVLGFNNYNDTTKVFADTIDKDRTFTQKLGYALKQNKIAFQTHFDIKISEEQKDCKIMLNGKALNQHAFIGPAGVPFYVGIYCPEYKFEVKKIQAAESQKFYSISFNNLKTTVYRDDPVDMGIPNPKSLRLKQQEPRLIQEKRSLLGLSELQIETGIGLDFYLNHSASNYYTYSHANDSPILLYSSTQFVFKNFGFGLDIGPVSMFRQSTYDFTPIVERADTVFVRPIFSYNAVIFRHKNVFALNSDAGISSFFAGTQSESSLKPMALGVTAGLEPKFYLWSPVYLGLDCTVTYNFIGQAQGVLFGASLRLGADL